MTSEVGPQTSPWYRPEIGRRLKSPTRNLFEWYSALAPNDVESHLHAIVRTTVSTPSQSSLTWPFSAIEHGLCINIRVLVNGHFSAPVRRPCHVTKRWSLF